MAQDAPKPDDAAMFRHRSRLLALFNGAHPFRRVIERVYVTYDGGTPMVHLSRGSTSRKDPDLIASMFTAIENFMDEGFHEMGIGIVRSIELDDRHQVAFGKGKWLLLFVVYRGRESNQLERHVIHQVHELEDRFADVLKDWDGDMAEAEALRRYLEEAWFLGDACPDVLPSPSPAESADAEEPQLPPPAP